MGPIPGNIQSGFAHCNELDSAQTDRPSHRLSALLEAYCESVDYCSFAGAIMEENAPEDGEEALLPKNEMRVVPEPSDVIPLKDQDRFLEAVGCLDPLDGKAFVEIVQRFHPRIVSDGPELEIHVEDLGPDCWRELIALAQKRFLDHGWTYPI
jgi:hypothetical protein